MMKTFNPTEGRVESLPMLSEDERMSSHLPRLHAWFRDLLYHPAQIFWICAGLAAIGVVLDGTALQLWSLHRDHAVITKRIDDVYTRSRQLEFRIQEAEQPGYIERQARDQFDLVKEGDLVFIFAEN